MSFLNTAASKASWQWQGLFAVKKRITQKLWMHSVKWSKAVCFGDKIRCVMHISLIKKPAFCSISATLSIKPSCIYKSEHNAWIRLTGTYTGTEKSGTYIFYPCISLEQHIQTLPNFLHITYGCGLVFFLAALKYVMYFWCGGRHHIFP